MCDISPVRTLTIIGFITTLLALGAVISALVANNFPWGVFLSPALMFTAAGMATGAFVLMALAVNAASTFCKCLGEGNCASACSRLSQLLKAITGILLLQVAACIAAAGLVALPWSANVTLAVIIAAFLVPTVLFIIAFTTIGTLSDCAQ